MNIITDKTYKSNEWEIAERDHKRLNPSEGDYWWEDHFCPVLVVLNVTGQFRIVCDKTKDAGGNKWTWDLTKPTIMDRESFEKKLEHSRVGGSHLWAVREFKNPAAVQTESKGQ